MRVALVALVPLVLLSSARAEDWPRFRGPTGMGTSTTKNPPIKWSQKENIIWKTELPGGGASSPVILGDKIFLTVYTGFGLQGQPGSMDQLKRHVLCLDRGSGKITWSKTVPSSLPDGPPPRDNHGFASSTPVVDNERIYTFFGKSGVFALDHAGKQIWHADVGSEVHPWGTGASPVLYKDLVIINASVESSSLFALDKKTGKERWRASGIREAWNTPLIVSVPGGKDELVVPIAQKIIAFEPESGKPLWSCKTNIDAYMVPSVVASGDIICCLGGRPGAGLAVRAGGRGEVTASHRLWRQNKGAIVPSPVVHEGHLYWMDDVKETAFCADIKTGNLLYEEHVPRAGQIYASPVLADGKIYYLSRMGTTFVVAARPQFQLLATNELGGRQSGDRGAFNASPAVADGRIYIRSDRFLYGIGAK